MDEEYDMDSGGAGQAGGGGADQYDVDIGEVGEEDDEEVTPETLNPEP